MSYSSAWYLTFCDFRLEQLPCFTWGYGPIVGSNTTIFGQQLFLGGHWSRKSSTGAVPSAISASADHHHAAPRSSKAGAKALLLYSTRGYCTHDDSHWSDIDDNCSFGWESTGHWDAAIVSLLGDIVRLIGVITRRSA
jgi:hypothetical protein